MTLDLVIVDDSRLWLSLAENLAKNHPLVGRVTTFQDSIDAWVHFQTHRPQVVMTDIEMPGMDGLSFLEMFGASIPFISSSTREGYALIARELGCIDFLRKPYSKNDFDRAVVSVHGAICSFSSAAIVPSTK
jgi:DNA-binding NarL/FixJ family response regulator